MMEIMTRSNIENVRLKIIACMEAFQLELLKKRIERAAHNERVFIEHT